MERTFFGTMPDGKAVERICLDSGKARCTLITYGAALVSLEVPDKVGAPLDVVLGFDSLESYLNHNAFMGAIVGRFANRIGGSRFALGGREYLLHANEPPNHLHGGQRGFDKRLWTAEEIPNGVRMRLHSPHMEEGYPGNLDVAVDYILSGESLTINYRAECDRDTVCSLTNHAYFNLEGHAAGSVSEHVLCLNAQYFTPVSDAKSIPTGEILPVAGTPMDFCSPTTIGSRIDDSFPQLVYGSGYDHNWVVDGKPGVLRPAARLYAPLSGISMEVETTLPGIQFYSGNYLDGCPAGKKGAAYVKRGGLCLETQFFPDSPNRAAFHSPVLKAGEVWAQVTSFHFGL